MINLLLCATLLCPIQLPLGTNTVDITAKYYHEEPQGQPYVFEATEAVEGPAPAVITAEGHPWHVTAMARGLQVANCAGQDAILIDGFESGNTRYW